MSSSPRTEAAPTARPARWNPAGWPLRTRLVAIMIALLAIFGLAVGGTAEIYLRGTLYHQLDDQLSEASGRAVRPPHPGDKSSFFWVDEAPPGAQNGSIFLGLAHDSAGAVSVCGGGIVRYQQSTETATTTGRPGDGCPQYYGPTTGIDRPHNGYEQLPAAAVAQLATVPPTNEHVDLDLGGDLGTYRVVGSLTHDGTMVVSGLPLQDTENTLLAVAGVTGGAILLALVAAGWAGAMIIRRSLKPLSRVAATATRVSELELDRGEVDLAQRVPAADTDPRTEVGAVGAALNRLLDHVGSALEARHASEMQVRQFVADASHELRTPLAAIRGYAELSRRSRQPVPDEVGHVLRRVESEATRMTVLVEDLLLLARLDAGRPLAHEPVDLTMLAVDAVSDAHAAGPRHDWRLDLPQEPVMITGDPQRLHQVLANLLANARTHTPEGTMVTAGVSVAEDQRVTLTVTDHGPGIPAKLQPHIFERFARGDSSRSRAAGSTGLGLSIVYAVVTAHGGTVAVHSRPGHTEFTVRLPMVAAPLAVPEYAGR